MHSDSFLSVVGMDLCLECHPLTPLLWETLLVNDGTYNYNRNKRKDQDKSDPPHVHQSQGPALLYEMFLPERSYCACALSPGLRCP